MIRVIGGTPRTGKSTLLRQVRTRHPDSDVLDLDRLRWAYAPIAGLDEQLETPERISGEERWHRDMDAREDGVFELGGRYARAVAWDGDDAILVGIIRPAHVAYLQDSGWDVQAAFLVDLGADSATRAIRTARTSRQNNWQAGWSDDDIVRWAVQNRRRAQAIADDAARLGLPVFDVSDGFADAQNRALAVFV